MNVQIKAALILSVAMLSFSAMSALVKMSSNSVPAMEAVFFRGIISLLIVAIMAKRKNVSLLGNQKKILLARAVSGTIALMMFFYAITKIPVANAILLNQATPIFVLPLAVVFLGERFDWRHIILILIAVAGVTLVIKPDINAFNIPGVLALVSAVFAAVAYVLVRKLTKTENTLTIVFWFAVATTIASVPFLLTSFVWPNPKTLAALIGLALCGTSGQLLLTAAYRLGEAGKLAVLGSMGAIFGAGWDYILWNHTPDWMTAIGGFMVILSCSMIQFVRHKKTIPLKS